MDWGEHKSGKAPLTLRLPTKLLLASFIESHFLISQKERPPDNTQGLLCIALIPH